MKDGAPMTIHDRRGRMRLLRFLRKSAAAAEAAAAPDQLLLDGGDRGRISVQRTLVDDLIEEGLVIWSASQLNLTPLGAALLADLQESPHRHQHAEVGYQTVHTEEGFVPLQVNRSESPLAMLARRKDRNGNPFLSEREFRAGERLRADYTRGQLMPRMSANWETPVSNTRRGPRDRITDLTDAALAARMRVNRALQAVGPELAGPLVDVCCFLKGIEQVESERGWPPRSAKLILKTALSVLSRHYEPETASRRQEILHWGTPDYRPTLTRS